MFGSLLIIQLIGNFGVNPHSQHSTGENKMDPITLITTAIAIGAANGLTDTASQAIKDTYQTLKKVISQEFGVESEVSKAVQLFEAGPASERLIQELTEALAIVQTAKIDKLTKIAQELMSLSQQQGQVTKYATHIAGDAQGLVQGDNANVTMTFGDNPPKG
jgi:hypothetical protein